MDGSRGCRRGAARRPGGGAVGWATLGRTGCALLESGRTMRGTRAAGAQPCAEDSSSCYLPPVKMF